MLSLSQKWAPEAVQVEGAFYSIHTDFRYWVIFARMLREEHVYSEYDFLYTENAPENRVEGFNALLEFFVDKHELPKVNDDGDRKPALDYDYDADLIFSAFWEVYGIDLTEVSLHWQKFKALLSGLHGTKLNDIINYRLYDPKEKNDYKKSMEEGKKMWALPEIYTEAEENAINNFDSQLKKKN